MRHFTYLFLAFAVCLSSTSHAAGSFSGLVIPNQGQLKGGEGVRYYMDAPWGRLYVTDHGLIVEIIQEEPLTNNPPAHPRSKFDPPTPRILHRSTVLLNLPGACWEELIPEDPQITKLNFFYGSNPKAWVTNVSVYGRLRIRSVFPGTDIVLDPKMPSLFITEGIEVGMQEVISYWIGNHFRSIGLAWPAEPPARHNAQAFNVSPPFAQNSQPQTLLWGTYLGGFFPDYIYALAVDKQDNVIVAGATGSFDFPVQEGYDTSFNGELFDAFAAKLSADGRQLLWGTFIGGSDDDQVYTMALESSGDLFLAGATLSTDAPVTPDAFDLTFNGYRDVSGVYRIGDLYVVRLSPQGDQLLFGTYIGGPGGDEAYACAVTEAGNLIVAGMADPGAPAPAGFDTTSGGMYLAELSGNGSQLLWGTFIGGHQISAIALDSSDEIILAGDTESDAMPVPGGYDPNHHRGQDMYIAKVSMQEDRVIWGTYLGGHWDDHARALALDNADNVVILGTTESEDLPTSSGYDPVFNGNSDMYIAKLSFDGSQLLWGTYIGGTAHDSSGYKYGTVLFNENSEILFSGSTDSRDIFVSNGYDTQYNGFGDIYLGALSASGDCMIWGTYLGGSMPDGAPIMTRDSEGNLIIAGYTASRDFPTPHAYDSTYNGPEAQNYADSIIVKLTADPSPSDHTLYIAAAAHTSGAYGTHWRTDGMLLNPGASRICYDLHFVLPGPSGGTDIPCESRCLEAQSAWYYQDILAGACGMTEEVSGSLRVDSPGALLMTTRTYNQLAQGTYGQSIEGVEESQAIYAGEDALVIALKQNSEFRTNLGFSEITGQQTEVILSIYDASGNSLYNSSFFLQPYQWWQASLPDFGIANIELGRAWIKVVSGGAVLAYASVADNRTGDAIYLPIRKAGTISTVEHLMIPVIAHAEGAYDTQWQSDLYYYLTSEAGREVTFTYTTASSEFKKTLEFWQDYYFEVKDVVAKWFPEAGNSSGVLRLDEAWGFISVSRTYNTTAAGTYGQFVPSADQARFLGPGQSGFLLQLQCTPQFRTNVGFSEYTGTETAVRVDLYASDGAILGSHPYSIGTGKNLQVSDIFGSLGAPCHYEAAYAMVVNLTGGAIHAYASVVDNRTGDGIYIPAQKYLNGGCHDL